MARSAQNRISAPGRHLAIRLLIMQGVVALAFIALFWVFQGAGAAFTALVGAAISLVPNIVFAAFAFLHGGARSARSVVNSFYAGEAFKLMLSVVLFILAFTLLNGPWLPFFIVYAVITFMHWLAPILLLKTN